MNVFFEYFDTNFDAKFEKKNKIFVAKNENFDEIIRFDIKRDKNIEIENVKNEINDKNLDRDTNFELSIEKNIDSNNVKNEIKINEFEITNFDFFA